VRVSLRAALLVILGSLGGCATDDPVPGIEDRREVRSAELMLALTHGSPEGQVRAALAMGRIQSSDYVGPLTDVVRGENDTLRVAALFALGQMGLAEGAEVPDVATHVCLDMLEDPNVDVVAAAVEALGKIAAKGIGASIVPLLHHESPRARAEAAHALFRLRFVPVWRGEADEPPALSPPAVSGLIDALDDDDAAVRRAAAHAFSRYGQPEAAPALVNRLEDDDEWVRLWALRALGKSGRSETAEALARRLRDSSPRVRTEALLAIVALGADVPLPGSLAEDPSLHVRAALASALGGRDDAEATLRRLERDPSPTVIASAIGALARRGGAEYRPAIEAFLADESWVLRVAAARATAHLGHDALELARVALGDPDPRVQAAALEAASGLDGGEALVVEALADEDLAVVRGGAVFLLADSSSPRKVEWFHRTYEDSPGPEWVEVREALIGAVTDDDQAGPLLRRAAEDPAPSVRLRARRALEDRGLDVPPAALPAPEASRWIGTTFDEAPVVVLETAKGTIEIQCLPDRAPIHVASFVDLVRRGFYDGLIWHRVVPNFVIQGGDSRGDGWGTGGLTLRDEIDRERFDRGLVGMPKAGKDTGGCQIFITHVPTPHLDGNYTIFGRVIAGMEVVDRIEVGDSISSARIRE
jgi:cyclophilin family peptidyl-prolyl cis-trans isomerase